VLAALIGINLYQITKFQKQNSPFHNAIETLLQNDRKQIDIKTKQEV